MEITKNKVIDLYNKNGLRGEDMDLFVAVFHKYIDPNAHLCTKCRSSLQWAYRKFKDNIEYILRMIDEQ